MPYASLRDFMSRLEEAGKLVRVATPVSPHLEMTEIQTRLLGEQGSAVLFENVILVGDRCYERRLAKGLTAWLRAPGCSTTVLHDDPARPMKRPRVSLSGRAARYQRAASSRIATTATASFGK